MVKKTAENAMLKLALNGTYGASNDVHRFMTHNLPCQLRLMVNCCYQC